MGKIIITENQYKRLVSEQTAQHKSLVNKLNNDIKSFKNQGYKRYRGSIINVPEKYLPLVKHIQFNLPKGIINPEKHFLSLLSSQGSGLKVHYQFSFVKDNSYVYFFIAT